ncbi:MAG: hypothetical protein IT305_21590 [Chloroflexi bacterium]|nr:hypothetical protein [Chloroflexota bacterium]
MHAFPLGVSECLAYYVYLLIDPRDNSVFYVGKGTANRCFAHTAEAHHVQADSVGDYAKLTRIRAIEAAHFDVRIELLRHGLSEHDALLIEAAAIDLLGLSGLENRVVGHGAADLGRMSLDDVAARYGAKPITISPEHRVVLIRISQQFEQGMSDDELYEATRKWWRMAARRSRVGGPAAPEYALAVYAGVVRAVYRIRSWEQATERDVTNEKWLGRWKFQGERDAGMEDRYLNGDVSVYLHNGNGHHPSQNPLKFVNCNHPLSRQNAREACECEQTSDLPLSIPHPPCRPPRTRRLYSD